MHWDNVNLNRSFHCLAIFTHIWSERKIITIPANTRHCINVGLTLVQRLRRWTNVKLTLIQCLVSTGMTQAF